MAVLRKQSDIPDILPLMNGQDTSLLYINEDVHKIKSHLRDSNFDSVKSTKSNKSLALFDPDITGKLAGEEELTMSHTVYDVIKGVDNVKSTTYNDVITARKFSLQGGKSPAGSTSNLANVHLSTINSSTGNLAHGSQATSNGDIRLNAKETQVMTVEASSPRQSTVSSVAHANLGSHLNTNLNSLNSDMQQGNTKQPMVNGNISTEHVELSTGNSGGGDNIVLSGSQEGMMSPSQHEQSNRSSQVSNAATERSEVTKRSSSVQKSGSFQIRSSMDRDSFHSESSSKGTSMAGSADITMSTDRVNEEGQATNQEIIRHSSGASSKERQGSRPTSAGSSSAAPSYMRDTNSSQAKRLSRSTERSPSTSSDKPPLYRSTSRTSSSGSRPPSGHIASARSSVSPSKRDSVTSQSPPPSPTKGGPASRSSSARRSEASARHTSPSPTRTSIVSSRSSSVKKRDSFTLDSPPASPTKRSATPPRTDSSSIPTPPTSPTRTPSIKSSNLSRSSSASRESSRPRKPSQDNMSVERNSTASVLVSESSVTRMSARNSVVSNVSSKPPSRTPSSASKPPSGSSQVSRQSSQKRASMSSPAPTSPRSDMQEKSAGAFVMKHAPGDGGGKGNSSANAMAPKFSASEDFELSANLLSSQKANLKTNGYSPKPRTFVDTNKTQFTAGDAGKSHKLQINTSYLRTDARQPLPSVTSPDVVAGSPLSPMDEMRSTVRSGVVGKLINDFKATPLTGRVFDPSSLERNKKQESPTRKFKFAVEGIDVPMSPTSSDSPATSMSPAAMTPATPITPGTVPPPPPINRDMLNQIAAAGTSGSSTTTYVTSETTTTTKASTSLSSTTAGGGSESVSAIPAAPPPPPPPVDSSEETPVSTLERPGSISDVTTPMNSLDRSSHRMSDFTPTNSLDRKGINDLTPMNSLERTRERINDSTPMNSLERERKRGFTYIPDDKGVSVMKKKAEDVQARKVHETVDQQVQSKRTSDIIRDHEVATLREARSKLRQDSRSPIRRMPSPPDYNTATLDNEAVIKVSSDGQKSNRNSQVSSSSVQKSNRNSQISNTNVQKSNRDSQLSSNTRRSSSDVKGPGSFQMSGSENKRSSVDIKKTVVQKTVEQTQATSKIEQRNENQRNENQRNENQRNENQRNENQRNEKQQLNVNVNSSGANVQKTSSQENSVTVTSFKGNMNGSPEVADQQTANKGENVSVAPPASPVKSQRSPDSAYHSDAQSPAFDLSKPLAPPNNNTETIEKIASSQKEVTVQRAAIESNSQPSQPSAQGPRESSSHTEEAKGTESKGSFQSETTQLAGQSSDSGGGVTAVYSVPSKFPSAHRELGPPKDTSSPLPATTYQYDGLLTTRSKEDIEPVRHSVDHNFSSSYGTVPTELISSTPREQRRYSAAEEEDNGKFSVHIQPVQGSHRITVGQHSPTYSSNSYSPQDNNYSSLPRSEGNYSYRQHSSGNRYYPAASPGPRQGYHPRYHQGLQSGSRVVPLQPVSVDIGLADGYSPRSPHTRHHQTIHGMSAMAGEVMQPLASMTSGGGRHFDHQDGQYVAEQYNFSTYQRSTGTKHFNGNGPQQPDVPDGNSSFNFNSLNYNANATPKRKYLKVDESRSNGRIPMHNGDLESYEYHQYNNRSPRYKMHSSRTTDDVFEDESIRSEPVYRHQRQHHHHGMHGMNSSRRLQKQHAFSRSQPHLNELGHPNSLGEPLYVSVPHSPPRYGTLRSARSETMLAQQSPSGGDGTLLLPHLEDARSKARSKYPYHITLKLNQLAASRPGSSHMSLQRSSRDGYYNSWQSERNQTQSLSGVYNGGGKRPMHTSSVSLVNIELDPRSPTGQQPASYREDGSYSRQERYSYQQQQQQQLQQQQNQEAYVFNGSLPRSHVESTQVINTNIGSPQQQQEKEFFLNIDNLPENQRVNNNYIFKSSSNQTNERVVNKRQNKPQYIDGKDPDFTMAINQTMTMDYLPKQKKKREERRVREEEYYSEIPRVERGSYLIKNSIDTTSAPTHIDVVDTDDLESYVVEENTNLFDRKYVTRRDNPGYMSDEEEEEVYIERKHEKPAFTNIFERTETTREEDVIDIPVSYKTTSHETSYSKQGNYGGGQSGSHVGSHIGGSSGYGYSASGGQSAGFTGGNSIGYGGMKSRSAKKPMQKIDRTDYEERITTSSSAHQRSEPRMNTTTERVEITEYELERLLKGAPPGSVKQTINVEREEEEILGPLPITHADGEESAAEGLLNFDTVSEKVELGIVQGKAQLTVKVRCERVVPIRGVDDMFKKSSVIVTRLIDIDMEATRERRHLLDNIMSGASKRTLNESTGHVRHSSQKTLNTKDTFQLYKTFMAMAEAEEGRDTKGEMHVEKRLEDERGVPDYAEFDIRTEDVDERVFGEPVEMEFDTDDLERRLESQMMSNGITNGTRLEAMPNGRGHVIKGQDPDTISYRSAASDNSGIIY